MQQAVHPNTASLDSDAGVAGNLLTRLSRRAAAVFARIKAQREASAMRNTLAGLSDAQRADIGADGLRDVPNKPIFVVDGAVMRRLMAMR